MPSALCRAAAIATATLVALAAVAFAGRAAVGPLVASVAIAVVAAWRPSAAAVIVAALAPIGVVISALAGIGVGWTTIVLLSALAGWWVRVAVAGVAPTDTPFLLSAGALALVALASGLALTWGALWAAVPADAGPAALARAAWTALGEERSPLHAAARFAAPVLTAVWIAETVRRDASASEAVVRMLVVSVGALATLSIYRLVEVAIRSNASLDGVLALARTLRVSPLITDVNALGSLFLLVSPVALDWCLDSRTRGRGVAVLAVVLAGAWLAGSRIAIALLPIAAVGLLAWRRRPNRLRLAGAGLIAAVLMAVAILTPSIRHVGASTAWAVRRDMGVVTARMLSAAPVFGVGIGEFSRQSTPLMPASLRALYARENAHNQFFQTAGELGLVGAMALAAVLWLMAQSIARQWGRPGHLAGLSVGVLAFLVSWLGQHPLLESHVAAAFWIAAGVLRGHVVVATVRTGWLTRLAAGLVGGIVVSLPLQTALRASRVDLAGTFVKASLVRDEPGSPRYWAIERDGTVYLPGQAVACAFELRARGIPGEADVTLQLDHHDAGRLRVRRGEWRRAEILLPRASRWPVANHRVDFAWTPEAVGLASLDVTEPACRLPAGSTHR